MATVFVLDQQGNPLDQTTRCLHVRLLLKSGKATVVQAKPFTIQLTYEAQNPEATKQYTLGIDPGRTNIGLSVVDQDGRCVFQAEAVTRNKDVPQLMKARAENRRAHRTYGRRKVRQRAEPSSRERPRRNTVRSIDPLRARILLAFWNDSCLVTKNLSSVWASKIRRQSSITASGKMAGSRLPRTTCFRRTWS